VSPVKYELGFYNPEDDILHSYRLETLKSCMYVMLMTTFQQKLYFADTSLVPPPPPFQPH
jgi:hypothetical protein